MSNLEILILETNELTQLTVNSIKRNMPRTKYRVVKCGDSKVGTAIGNCDKPTLVVTSGLVLDIRQGDIPPEEKIKEYDICVSRMGVYVDHPRHSTVYKLVDSPIHKGFIDLSIFIINPANWYQIPNSDSGILGNKKCLYMPRYINHKHDPIVKDCIGSYEAFRYGMSGESAAVFNYIPHLLSGKATPVETFAYCFDKVAEYTDGLPEEAKQRILKLGNKSKIRVAKMRKALYELKLGET
jgi:hypothetical protein